MCWMPNLGDPELNREAYGTSLVPLEHEARFQVLEFDENVLKNYQNPVVICQHYIVLGNGDYARIRSGAGKYGLTVKRGWGLVREEPKLELTEEVAGWLIGNLNVRELNKTRYLFPGGWSLDVYSDPEAEGLVVLEYEGANPHEAAQNMPAWVKRVREVTTRVDNATIAKWVWEKRHGLSEWSVCERMKPVARFSLDGGPGCGKTTLVKLIANAERYKNKIVIVPEAARLMVEHGFVNIPIQSPAGMVSFEGALFRTHEELFFQAESHARRTGALAVLEDRHPVHPLCYLNNNRELFEKASGTTVEREMAKGDLIIYLALPTREIYERMAANDPVRYESYDQALARDQMFREAYQGFGDRLVTVPFEEDFEAKVAQVMALVDDFLATRAA